jgi:seryl-tRNA synthetase
MTELPKDPSNRELLERIVNLEAENTALRAQIGEVQNRHDKGIERIYEHVNKLAHQVGTIDEQVLELLEKAFPGHARTQLQIIEIFKSSQKAD